MLGLLLPSPAHTLDAGSLDAGSLDAGSLADAAVPDASGPVGSDASAGSDASSESPSLPSPRPGPDPVPERPTSPPIGEEPTYSREPGTARPRDTDAGVVARGEDIGSDDGCSCALPGRSQRAPLAPFAFAALLTLGSWRRRRSLKGAEGPTAK